MSEDARRALGQTGEDIATEHLQRLGFTVLDRNYRTRWGELDIIAFDGTTLAFCEVKTRTARVDPRHPRRIGVPPTGAPLEAIHRGKRAQVRKMAGRWLIERVNRPYAELIRFDAIGITFDQVGRLLKLEHVEGAF